MQRLREIGEQNTLSIQEYNINVIVGLNQNSLYKSPVLPRINGQEYSNALV